MIKPVLALSQLLLRESMRWKRGAVAPSTRDCDGLEGLVHLVQPLAHLDALRPLAAEQESHLGGCRASLSA